jgi:putative membrane protein
MLYLDTQLSGFLEVCGGCERIKNTPIPYSYSSFHQKVHHSVCHGITDCLCDQHWSFYDSSYGVCLLCLMSLELIAEEIEDPFNNDENDIPMEALAQNIERNVHQIMGLKKLP